MKLSIKAHRYMDETYGEDDPSKINPFHALGLGPNWIKRIDPRQIPGFLQDFKKLLSKYFHPDQAQDPSRKIENENIMRQINSIMDSLKTRYDLDKALAELRDQSYEGRLASQLEAYKKLCKEKDLKIEVLEKRLKSR
jgi:hypothetical protein